MITMANVTKNMTDNLYMMDNGEDNLLGFWHGRLAERMGCKGPIELSQYETFKSELDNLDGQNNIIFKDISFSVPKSISNLLAYKETSGLVIESLLEANEKVLHSIEDNYLQDMAVVSFVHKQNRAMECDLHVHNMITNITYLDRKAQVINWQKLVKDTAKIDLEYLQEILRSLYKRGIRLA